MKIFTWKQRAIVLGVTILLVLVFAAVGYGIGSLFDNWKLGAVLGVLVSYPFTQFALIRAMKGQYKPDDSKSGASKDALEQSQS